MKRSISISLLLLLFYTQLGYYGQFLICQWQLKEAAREAYITALPDTALFPISLADLNAHGKWEEEGRECWFNDHLYDVVRQKTIDGKTWLFCFDDDNEEQLIRRSGEYAHAGHEQSDKKSAHGLSFRSGDIVFDTVLLRIYRPSPYRCAWSRPVVHRLPTQFTEITIPPPKA